MNNTLVLITICLCVDVLVQTVLTSKTTMDNEPVAGGLAIRHNNDSGFSDHSSISRPTVTSSYFNTQPTTGSHTAASQ